MSVTSSVGPSDSADNPHLEGERAVAPPQFVPVKRRSARKDHPLYGLRQFHSAQTLGETYHKGERALMAAEKLSSPVSKSPFDRAMSLGEGQRDLLLTELDMLSTAEIIQFLQIHRDVFLIAFPVFCASHLMCIAAEDISHSPSKEPVDPATTIGHEHWERWKNFWKLRMFNERIKVRRIDVFFLPGRDSLSALDNIDDGFLEELKIRCFGVTDKEVDWLDLLHLWKFSKSTTIALSTTALERYNLVAPMFDPSRESITFAWAQLTTLVLYFGNFGGVSTARELLLHLAHPTLLREFYLRIGTGNNLLTETTGVQLTYLLQEVFTYREHLTHLGLNIPFIIAGLNAIDLPFLLLLLRVMQHFQDGASGEPQHRHRLFTLFHPSFLPKNLKSFVVDTRGQFHQFWVFQRLVENLRHSLSSGIQEVFLRFDYENGENKEILESFLDDIGFRIAPLLDIPGISHMERSRCQLDGVLLILEMLQLSSYAYGCVETQFGNEV